MAENPQNGGSSALLAAPLQDFGKDDLALAGGKGANLGELVRAGFDVPPGFVITTASYDLLVQSNNLGDGPSADTSPGSQGDTLRRLIDHASIPNSIQESILRLYRLLGSPAVAVRSSATAEDLPGAAFAGQQETFLNVQGESALLDAVRACWASLWSERAIAYRARQQVDPTTVKLAVVVQKMVDADAAGVMFSADPVTGARDELVIDANPGLGEAVVAGMVTPDHIVIDKRSKRITQQRLGRREVIVRSKAGGGTEQVKGEGRPADAFVLPESAARKLGDLGMRIESHYGAPQDIEWAWLHDGAGGGRFLILQARPMTALPEPIMVSGPMRVLLPILAEMWPERPYPLDMTTFTGMVERAIGHLIVTLIGSSAPDPDKALVEEDGVVVRFAPPQMRPRPGMLVTPFLALWRTRRYDPPRWQADPLLADFIARARELDARNPRRLTWEQNLDILHAALALIPQAMEIRERYVPRAGLDLGRLWLLLRLTGHAGGFGDLVSGIETKTAETNRALEALAARIRRDASLRETFTRHDAVHLRAALEQSDGGRGFLRDFDVFLEQYGHRETTLTISQPAWKDEPAFVMGILKVLSGADARPARDADRWQQARDELLHRSALGHWPLRAPFLKWLANARLMFQIREDTHFYVTMVQPAIRHVALELGRRLQEAGAIDAPEEVLHLRLEELEALGDPWPPDDSRLRQVRALVAGRKAKRESLAGRPLFDPRLLARGSADGDDENVLLRGSSGSPGAAEGPARIVHDSSEFGKLLPGDVLVAPMTNPAWTPLFQRAAAVVVDTGGAASHAAIVAREYGLPAVMGTVDGTARLVDGQQIRVDGMRGLVLRGKES